MRKIEFTPLELHPKGDYTLTFHHSRKPSILRRLFFYKFRSIPKKERSFLYGYESRYSYLENMTSLGLTLQEKARFIRFLCAKFKGKYHSSMNGYFAFDFKSSEDELFSIRISRHSFDLGFTMPIKENSFGNFGGSAIWAQLPLHKIIYLSEKLGLAMKLNQLDLKGVIQHDLYTNRYEELHKWLHARYNWINAATILNKIETRDINRLSHYLEEKNPSLIFATAALRAADRRFKRFLHYLFEPIETENGLVHFNFRACSKNS